MSVPAIPAPAPALNPGKTKWFAFAAVAVAAAAFLLIALGGIGENLVYYWGPKELRAAGDKAIGATIRLADVSRQVVGVLPAGFHFPDSNALRPFRKGRQSVSAEPEMRMLPKRPI